MPDRPTPIGCDCSACAHPTCPLRDTCRRAAGHLPGCLCAPWTYYPGGYDCDGYWPEGQ